MQQTALCFKHFDDIKPNNKAQFEMLYFSAQRAALRRFKLKLNKIYGDKMPKHLQIELKQLNHKPTQMAGVRKWT